MAKTSCMARGDKVQFLPVGVAVDRRPKKEEPYSIPSKLYEILPKGHLVVADNRGIVLPRCDVFFLPRVGGTKRLDEANTHPDALAEAEDFYCDNGKCGDSDLGQSIIRLPKGAWDEVIETDWIEYYRWSMRVYSGKYHHGFKKPLTLYKNKSMQAWKLPLPDGCRLTWRGFVFP